MLEGVACVELCSMGCSKAINGMHGFLLSGGNDINVQYSSEEIREEKIVCFLQKNHDCVQKLLLLLQFWVIKSGEKKVSLLTFPLFNHVAFSCQSK